MNKRALFALQRAVRAAKLGERARLLHLLSTALVALGYEKPKPKES